MKIIFTTGMLLLVCSCTIPRIVILEDPLTATQHNELGYIYEDQVKYELAEREYTRAIKKRKDWAVPYFNLGNVYFKMGNHSKAEKFYRQALEIDGKNPDIMNNLAYVLYEQGQYDEAEKWIEKALSVSMKEEYLDTQRMIFLKTGSFPLGP